MSEENIEIVRRWLEALGSLGPEALAEEIKTFWDRDCDYYPARKFLEARPCHGLADLTRFVVEYRAVWKQFHYEIKQLIPVGDDRVLAHGSMGGEGVGSGLPLEGDVYHSIWLRHGRLLRSEDHLTLAGGLHALGLSGDSLEAAGLRG